MNYSVQGVREYFKLRKKDVKQGTIETFRSKLQDAGIIGNNQSMTEEHLQVFEKIVNEKNDNTTWESLMNKYIFTDLRKYMQHEFKWTEKIILRQIIKAIEDKDYKVESFNFENKEDMRILSNCIDNFAELGKTDYFYQGSLSTDAGILWYKVLTQNNTQYYIISKMNPKTGDDDIHIFYNPYLHFEIMQCKYVMEVNSFDEMYQEFRECILKNSSK